MTLNYTLFAILVVASVTTVTANKTEKGKTPKTFLLALNCLTTESTAKLVEAGNATAIECREEAVLNLNGTTASNNTNAPAAAVPNSCVMECYWRKSGVVKDGAVVIEDFAKVNVKVEYQEKLTKDFNRCLTKNGLSTNYTVNIEDGCKALAKYATCFQQAAEVCKNAIGSDNNNSDDDSDSSEEDD